MTQNNEDKLNQKISKLRHKKDLLRSNNIIMIQVNTHR